jgi:DNA-binding MltR family transcriptional regulator
MIDTISNFLTTVVGLLQDGVNGFVNAIAGLFV